MVYSQIIYGIVLYGVCRSSLLNKVQVLQNKLIKVLYKLPYRTDTDALHSNLDILKFKDICKYQIQKFVYESVNKTCITQFHNYYKNTHNEHNMDTRQENLLYTRIPKTKYEEYSLKPYGAEHLFFQGDQLDSANFLVDQL